MTTSFNPIHTDVLQARYSLRVGARLSAGLDELPHDVMERLRVARQQAVMQRKQPQAVARLRPASQVSRNGHTATLGAGDDRMGFGGWLTSGLLALALAAGLVGINIAQDDDRAMEVADVDAVLLTDDLPPEAYADPGFLQYLKVGHSQQDTSH
jgi:acyl dehydratase